MDARVTERVGIKEPDAFDFSDLRCQGCGMEDPCGVHYTDCLYLEEDDIPYAVERTPAAEVAP